MPASQKPELTAKGAQTREHLLDNTLKLFTQKGYAATTMRDIAAASQTSLGLAYRYFASKDELVLALYARLTNELAEDMRSLPRVSLAERYKRAMQLMLAQLAPYRNAFEAIGGSLLAPQSGVAVLGERTLRIRREVRQLFLSLVSGASDAPRGQQAHDLTALLSAAHLLLLLFWLHDRTPAERATQELLKLTCDMLALARPVLGIPPFSRFMARVARIISPVFFGDES